ncbi:MAG TPA: hypothetical protein VF122_04745 [Caulobacteraceae bacterium]
MRGRLAALTLALTVSACSPAIEGVDKAVLDDAVGAAIGDFNTCVLLVNGEGDVAWRYGTRMTCARQLPACAGGDNVTTVDLLAEAAATKGFETAISCPSKPDGSTTVGWAAGPVQARQGLFYAAVMEGERALPGREIKLRLENALAKAGL